MTTQNTQAQPEQQFLVTESLLQNVLVYLSNKPYRETADLIQAIRSSARPFVSAPAVTEGEANAPEQDAAPIQETA